MEALSDQAQRALTEMAWVRQLARALLHDDATADDVAQDAFVIAANKAPANRPLRPWLSRVVLNLVRMRARSTKRSEARESVVADAATPASTPEELVARVEIQRVVASEVLELREPYRSTILLHYVEGLSSAEIAKKLDVPDGTVRRRLTVAHAELRQRLEARDDAPRGGWLAALVPFVGMPRASDAAPLASDAAASHAANTATSRASDAASSRASNATSSRASDAATSHSPATASPLFLVTLLALVGVVGLVLVLWLRREPTAAQTSAPPMVHATLGRPSPAAPPTAVPRWLIQDGVAARRVAGTITSAGVPLPFATVRLAVVISPSQTLLVTERTTGADGRFDFGVQPAASFVVSAQAAEHAPGSFAIDVANPRSHPDAIAIDLDPCFATLVGTVRDASGGGIARARLSVAGQADTLSDDTGAYSLCVPSGERVRVDADGYGSRDVPTFLLGGVARYDVVLVPEAIVIGRVVDSVGRPVAGAHVTITPEGVRGPFGLAAALTQADSDGRFRITGIGPGKFRVDAMSEERSTATPTVVFARPGTESADLALVLVARSRVRGTVVSNGKPVAGAQVMVIDHQRRPAILTEPGPTAYSQNDGTFVLETLPGTFDVLAAPFEVVTPASLTISGPEVTTTVEVKRRATLRGRVVAHGSPVAGAEVHCMALPPSSRMRTGADGTFVFEGVGPGRTHVEAIVSATQRYGSMELEVGTTDVEDITLEVPWSAQVNGRVVDESGRPTPDAFVMMLAANSDFAACPTDARGEFHCVGLAGGSDYIATVHPSAALQHPFVSTSGAPARIHVADGETILHGVELAIRLERTSIRGRVIDDAKAGVADCHIMIAGDMSPQPRPSLIGIGFEPPTTMTARDGSFEIGNLAPGTYSGAITCADGSTAEVNRIAAGESNVEIVMHRAGRITGHLVGFTATPAVHTYRITPTIRMGFMAVVSGNTFTFDGIPPGVFPVEAIAGLQTDAQLVEVKPGDTTTLELTARPTAPVTGRVIALSTKAPVSGMTCQARALAGGFHGDLIPIAQSQPTGPDGRFSLVAPSGRVRILCGPSGPPLTYGGTDVELPSTQTIDVVVTKFPPQPSIAGFQLRPMFLPLTVWAIDVGGPATGSGLRVDDVITSINDQPGTGLIPMAAQALIMSHPAGQPLTLGIERAGSSLTVTITPVQSMPPP